MSLHPEMMSYAFNVHDEHFQPDLSIPANEQYAIHPRTELIEFCQAAREHGVKPEVESFYTGAF
jgi:3-keto-5-aminohexanoate cleavage enzyme